MDQEYTTRCSVCRSLVSGPKTVTVVEGRELLRGEATMRICRLVCDKCGAPWVPDEVRVLWKHAYDTGETVAGVEVEGQPVLNTDSAKDCGTVASDD